MRSDGKQSRADRIFRSLLRVLPFEFRGDFGPEMVEVFREQRDDVERHEGRLGLFRLWMQTLADVFRTAPRQHLEMLRQDLGFALRTMRNNRRFTLVTVLILGLGIGANTAIFSVVHGVMLRPLPYEGGERLLVLRQEAPGRNANSIGISPTELHDYRDQNQTLEGIAEYHSMPFILLGRGEPERLQTGVVSANFFELFKVQPFLGRTFLPEDETHDAPSVLVLSYGYWKRSHGADPNILGKTFEMNDRVHTVIGVLPPLPQFPQENDVYMAVPSCPFRSSQRAESTRTFRMLQGYGKLKAGVGLSQAQAELSTVAARLEAQYPDVYPRDAHFGVRVNSVSDELTRNARSALLILLATAGFVLLIACANVANLVLSRQLRREREMAMRAALGARSSRLLRQLLTESALLSLFGAGVGLLLAAFSTDLLAGFAARMTPRAAEIRTDGWVLGFTLGVSFLTSLIFGSLPALPTRRNLLGTLNQSAGRSNITAGRRSLRAALVVAQVAASLVLLVGAGLMVRSLVKLQSVSAGFDPENVLTMLVDLDWARYNQNERVTGFHDDLLERLRSHAGVTAAAISASLPLNESQQQTANLQVEGQPPRDPNQPPPLVDFLIVTPDYFRALAIPLVRGRGFTESDRGDAQLTAIISQSMARRFWPNDDPLGKRVSVTNGQTWATVVGVVGDVKQHGLQSETTDALYRPMAEVPQRVSSLLVRTASDPAAMSREIVSTIYAVDPRQPVAQVSTLEQIRSDSIAAPRLTTALLSLFALLALVITIAGVGGVLGLSVSQRTGEIGIRMALGATREQVRWMILREGMLLVVAGLAVGLGGALLLSRSISGLLFRVSALDPLTLAGVSLILLVVAAAACLVPASRATAIEPMVALRNS